MLRNIDPLIENYINQNILKPVIEPKQIHIAALKSMVGILEHGDNAGPLVESIQRTVGDASKESWCMSLQQTAIAYTEKKTGTSCPIMASEHCLTVFNHAKSVGMDIENPEIGSLMFWKMNGTQYGHVGCIVDILRGGIVNGSLLTVEGNTSSGSGVNREGDGVYERVRSPSGSGKMFVVGYVKVIYLKNK